MSQSSNHLRLGSWTWQWVHFTQIAASVSRSQSNRAPLGCGGFVSWMCSWQICSNCVMLSCQCGPKSLRNVSNTLLNLCHEELRHFWRRRGVQPDTSKVYLLKWPVCVCVCVYIYIHTVSHKIVYTPQFFLNILYLFIWQYWRNYTLLCMSSSECTACITTRRQWDRKDLD